MLDLSALKIDYLPFPIGMARPVMDEAVYDELVETFPSTDLFKTTGGYGEDEDGLKLGLSTAYNPENYHRFLENTPAWRAFRDAIHSESFVRHVLETLLSLNIDLGLLHRPYEAQPRPVSRVDLFKAFLKGRPIGRRPVVRTRFEFSMIPARHGALAPHTDHPKKLVSLVLSMAKKGEWLPEYGGSTDVVMPKDPAKVFNVLNQPLGQEEVDTLGGYAYEPNQCLAFVKTFNSWHAVRPTAGPEGLMRRTVTINITE